MLVQGSKVSTGTQFAGDPEWSGSFGPAASWLVHHELGLAGLVSSVAFGSREDYRAEAAWLDFGRGRSPQKRESLIDPNFLDEGKPITMGFPRKTKNQMILDSPNPGPASERGSTFSQYLQGRFVVG